MKRTCLTLLLLVSGLFTSALSFAAEKPKTINVKIETSAGDMVVALYPDKAQASVNNFLSYVDSGFYKGTIFHRVIKDFMIQGGGFDSKFVRKSTNAPIVNESSNGLSNKKGFLAMARTQAPNSATSQFFINTKDNDFLNFNNGRQGYAVFGEVISGYNIVQAIESVETATKNGHQNVPVQDVVIKDIKRL